MQRLPKTLVASLGPQDIEIRELRVAQGLCVPLEPSSDSRPDPVALLRRMESRLDSLYAASPASLWRLTRAQFGAAVEKSVAKSFAEGHPTPESVTEFLESLHMDDLVLAAACMQGSEAAWEHFVAGYRSYLRAVAGSLTKGSSAGTDAYELADSLFAELFGLVDGKRGEASLFRYFHGRSSLKTWLRTVLAQRHIDRIRQSRRWQSIEPENDGEEILFPAQVSPAPLLDPHRPRYLGRFLLALEDGLGTLHPGDRQRLELYYAREKTLAEIGRLLGEHESTVSRQLDRARHELRAKVEQCLRSGRHAGDCLRQLPPLSDAEIDLCFQYASEDSPIDFRQIFPEKAASKSPAGRKESR
jgi:RNA polymerase sigma-70 factor (ECF subfamily)